MARIFYIGYGGILEPLGESRVLGYLETLYQTYEVHLNSFENPAILNHRCRLGRLKGRFTRTGVG